MGPVVVVLLDEAVDQGLHTAGRATGMWRARAGSNPDSDGIVTAVERGRTLKI
jgi:hypothetical protein